jgi:ParB family chromosome partitioning protein
VPKENEAERKGKTKCLICADAVCFNRKLDAHIAQGVTKIPNLVQISENFNATGETSVLSRRNYAEVVTRKDKRGKNVRPEEKLCAHLTPAIDADGMDKGRLVKVCADPTCKIHFGNGHNEEKQRLRWKAESATACKIQTTLTIGKWPRKRGRFTKRQTRRR